MGKIIACVVTFNRLELLKKVVNGLRNQTYKIDEILVVNNSSTDGTEEWLSEQTDISVVKQANLGSSGGQYAAAKYAYENNADHVWLMDDDVVADENCLMTMLKYIEHFDIICPLRHNLNGVYYNDVTKINLTNPLKSIWKSIIDDEDLKKDIIPVEGFTFEGPLISRKVIEKIGLPEKGFFIYGDDTEFSVRAYQNGFTAAVARDAKFSRMIMPIGDKDEFNWKTYYMVRNLIAIDVMHCSNAVKFIRPFGYYLSFVKTAKNFEQHKTLLKALFDGLRYKSHNR